MFHDVCAREISVAVVDIAEAAAADLLEKDWIAFVLHWYLQSWTTGNAFGHQPRCQLRNRQFCVNQKNIPQNLAG